MRRIGAFWRARHDPVQVPLQELFSYQRPHCRGRFFRGERLSTKFRRCCPVLSFFLHARNVYRYLEDNSVVSLAPGVLENLASLEIL